MPRSWSAALASAESGDREEIVIDWFDDLKLEGVEEEGVEKQDVTTEDESVIVLPFFSHEVTSLSELPEKEQKWNFVEISRETHLLAMENPRQKRLRTFRGSGKKRARRRRKITREEMKKVQTEGLRKDGEVVRKGSVHTYHHGIKEEQTREMINEIRAFKLDRDNYVHKEAKQTDNSETKVTVMATGDKEVVVMVRQPSATKLVTRKPFKAFSDMKQKERNPRQEQTIEASAQARQYYPDDNHLGRVFTDPGDSLVSSIPREDPWKAVNIVEDQGLRIAFGSYDKFGQKFGQHQRSKKQRETGTKMDDFNIGEIERKFGVDDRVINITVDINNLPNKPRTKSNFIQKDSSVYKDQSRLNTKSKVLKKGPIRVDTLNPWQAAGLQLGVGLRNLVKGPSIQGTWIEGRPSSNIQGTRVGGGTPLNIQGTWMGEEPSMKIQGTRTREAPQSLTKHTGLPNTRLVSKDMFWN